MSRRTIKTFDDFVDEAGSFLPSDEEIDFSVTDPLERYFFEVADKHGILDAILNGEFGEGE